MSKLPIDNASIKIKRKRASVWPFATRDLCEQIVKLLIEDDLVRELSPPRRMEDPSLNGSPGEGIPARKEVVGYQQPQRMAYRKAAPARSGPNKADRENGF